MTTAAVDATTTDRHPPGLFLLFFVEMWERFSFYGMRALLVFYLTKGFLQASDAEAYGIYGAYGALVWATPFIGGIIADKILGLRLSIILGGLLMAAGHLVMIVETPVGLYTALALLIVGNGFFKPNISTMVGALYPQTSPRRDSGFTIFYMGINLGAALAPLVCGYIGETYGWHYGFGLATIGMLVGVATFVVPSTVSRFLILATALGAAAVMVVSTKDDRLQFLLNAPVAIALLVAAGIAAYKLSGGGIPAEIGRPPMPGSASPVCGRCGYARVGLRPDAVCPECSTPYRAPTESLLKMSPLVRFLVVTIGTLAVVPGIALLVSRNEAAGYVLIAFGVVSLVYLVWGMVTSTKIERERLGVVFVLLFFTMLFWAIFEQAGSSVNNFTDRNVDRVVSDTQIVAGQTYSDVIVTQEFYGQTINGTRWELADIERVQKERIDALTADPDTTLGTVTFTATPENELLGVGGNELKASVFQAVNPIYILLFGLGFSALWGYLGRLNKDPSAPFKFGLGLIQLGLGFGVLWYGAKHSDSGGMVAMQFLLLSYALQTTGELCLSPVGLSLVTKLSPTRMASAVMGTWFLATAFSHYLAGFIAKLTSGAGSEVPGAATPPPWETVHTYGTVFGQLGIVAIAAGFVLFALTPLLRKWMHLSPDVTARAGH
ncbi:MAG: peptide MFS transporter [Phycisphaerae bacterium]|nr:peptide MFS transporter [Phycisphaerae bacterium]